MKKKLLATLCLLPLASASVYAQPQPSASAQTAPPPPPLSVSIKGIINGVGIPPLFAYCAPDGNGKTKNGGNLNPAISWSGAPEGTKSYAIIVVDRDVPVDFTNANKEGASIAADALRQDFYHWVLVDIPASMNKIEQGFDSRNWLAQGKPVGQTAHGLNGQNDYAKFSKGSFGGYDGPCPPWNDERLHRYYFQVYALDVSSLGLSGNFSGKDAEAAIQGHVLAMGEVMGTYTQNRSIKN